MSNCPRVEWITKPGLWDPYIVARVAVQVLMRDVYPILKRKLTGGTTVNGKGICPGLKVYLEPEDFKPDIEKMVDQYIKFPCQTKLQEVLRVSSKDTLQFLVTFLRRRGPLIRIPMVSAYIDDSRAITNCVLYVSQQLQKYPELDSCAFTIIGRYLSYLIRVSNAHEIYIMEELLAKFWGPIFITFESNKNLKKHCTSSLTTEDQVIYAVKVYRTLLIRLAWEQYRPAEDMWRTIHHTPYFYESRRHRENAEYIIEKKTIPEALNNTICINSLAETIAGKFCPDDSEKSLTTVETRDIIAANAVNLCKNFPPDKCSMDYSDNRPSEPYL